MVMAITRVKACSRIIEGAGWQMRSAYLWLPTTLLAYSFELEHLSSSGALEPSVSSGALDRLRSPWLPLVPLMCSRALDGSGAVGLLREPLVGSRVFGWTQSPKVMTSFGLSPVVDGSGQSSSGYGGWLRYPEPLPQHLAICYKLW